MKNNMIKELIMYMEEKGYKNPSIRFSYEGEKEKYEFYADNIYFSTYIVGNPEGETRKEKRDRYDRLMIRLKEIILQNVGRNYFDPHEDLTYLDRDGIEMIIKNKSL